jgi:hypothetical protein
MPRLLGKLAAAAGSVIGALTRGLAPHRSELHRSCLGLQGAWRCRSMNGLVSSLRLASAWCDTTKARATAVQGVYRPCPLTRPTGSRSRSPGNTGVFFAGDVCLRSRANLWPPRAPGFATKTLETPFIQRALRACIEATKGDGGVDGTAYICRFSFICRWTGRLSAHRLLPAFHGCRSACGGGYGAQAQPRSNGRPEKSRSRPLHGVGKNERMPGLIPLPGVTGEILGRPRHSTLYRWEFRR